MEKKEHESDDPMELRGEEITGDARVMLDCVIEEYLDQDFNAEQVFSLFETPFYQAAHNLLKIFGRDIVLQAVKEKAARRSAFRIQELPSIKTLKGGEHEQGL